MIHLVISNYNADPSYLFELSDSYTIYDQSDDRKTQDSLKQLREEMNVEVHFTENLGHNLNNILDYIIDNYDQLPDKIAFLKGNIVPRHCSLLFVSEAIKKGFYTQLWNQEEVNDRQNIQYVLSPGQFLEVNNSWFVWDAPHKYFTSLNQLLDFLFADYRQAAFMNFAPGGNYLVEASRIRYNPKSLYQGLRVIIGYTWRPAEAFMLERILPLVFNRTHQLKPHCFDFHTFISELEKLPEVSISTKPKPKENLQNKVRWKLIEILHKQVKKI